MSVKFIVGILIDFRSRLNGNQWMEDQVFSREDRNGKKARRKIRLAFLFYLGDALIIK